MNKLLIKTARVIATMNDKRTRIENGAIYIEDKVIRDVGPSASLEKKYLRDKASDLRIIDATDKVILPGFVNTHHHLYQTLCRNIPATQDAKLFDWIKILYQVWREITPEGVYVSAQLGLGELLLTGCTTTSDQFYIFPQDKSKNLIDEEIKAARELGIRFHPCRGSMSLGQSQGGLPPDDLVQGEEEILADCERLINQYHDAREFSMLRIALGPCSPFSVTRELLEETIKFARKKKVICHTHVAETLDEEDYCLEAHKMKPVAYLESLGWLGPDVWFAHAIHLSDEEIGLLAKTKTGVAHCPTSNLRLGSGIAPIRKMCDAGVPVSLAVDGSASNDSSDMLGELRQCLLIHRIKSGIESMPADDVLWMATRGGAQVLGRDDIGSIENGKAADLIFMDIKKLGYAGGLHDPVAAVLFAGDSHIVDTAIVNGKILVQDGKLLTLDEGKIVEEANRIASQMIERAGKRTGIDYFKKSL
jgi:cytosine/adenosine deaminase-related metal-dependent hydrolase